jgi:nitrogenase molybdenum-iron protein alpha/beta subunit
MSRNALRDFARLLDDPTQPRTEALIAREEARLAWNWRLGGERLRGKRALLYTGGVKSWSIVAALQDLGMHVVATGTKKSTEEDKERIQGADGRGRQDDRRRQRAAIADSGPRVSGRYSDCRRSQSCTPPSRHGCRSWM